MNEGDKEKVLAETEAFVADAVALCEKHWPGARTDMKPNTSAVLGLESAMATMAAEFFARSGRQEATAQEAVAFFALAMKMGQLTALDTFTAHFAAVRAELARRRAS